MMTPFIRVAAICSVASGGLLLAFWYLFAILLPYRKLSGSLSILVLNRHWTMVNALGVCGALLGLLGVTGAFVSQIGAIGPLGLAGYLVAVIGTAALLATLVWDTVLWPILARQDPSLLDFTGPIYSSKTFLPFFISAGVIYAIGYVLFGVATARAAVLPSAAGILIAIGAPLFALGSMFGLRLQVYPRTAGVTLLSIGLIWLGLGMW